MLKRRLFLLFFLVLLTILCVSQGRIMFEENHHKKFSPEALIKEMPGFAPEKTVSLWINYYDTETPLKLFGDLMEITEAVDGDLVLHVATILEDETIYGQTYIHSNEKELLPPFFYSDLACDWSRTATRAYVWPPEDEQGTILRMTDLSASELDGEKVKQLYSPMSMARERFAGRPESDFPSIRGYLVTERRQEALRLLRLYEQNEYPYFGGIHPYDEFNETMKLFAESETGPAYTIIYLFAAALFAIIVASYSLDVVEMSKEIGIRKMLGQSTSAIAFKLFLPFNGWMALTLLVTTLATLLVTVTYWNALFLEFLKLLLLFIAAVLLMVALSFGIAVIYIKRVRPVISTKKTRSLTLFSNISLVLKMILVLLIAAQLFDLFPPLNSLYNASRAERRYARNQIAFHVEDATLPFEDEAKRMSKSSEIKNYFKKHQHEWGALTSNYVARGAIEIKGVDEKGELMTTEVQLGCAQISYQVTLMNKILDADGERIQFDAPPETTVLLVPEGAKLEDASTFMLDELTRGKKTIPIKRNQKILLPTGEVAYDSILILVSSAHAKAYANYVPDTVENRESIRKVMDAGGYPPDWYELRSEPMIQAKELDLQAVRRPAVIMAYLLVSFAFLSYQNAAVYFLDKNKWLNLAYLHGTPFLRRYRFLWLRVLIPYVTALLAVTLFPDFFRQIMNLSYEGYTFDFMEVKLACNSSLALFTGLLGLDVLIHILFTRCIQKRMTTMLKGEK